jgi:hypothetical protein
LPHYSRFDTHLIEIANSSNDNAVREFDHVVPDPLEHRRILDLLGNAILLFDVW